MSPEFLDRASAYFRQHEGAVPHMYLCLHGLVTAGVGHMFPHAKAARTVMWHRQDGTLAAPVDVENEFNAIKGRPHGQNVTAASFAGITRLRLRPDTIEGILRGDLMRFEQVLAEQFSDWDHWPEAAQLAMLDMVFSIGPAMFGKVAPKAYPKLVAAARNRDWATCATECKRRGVAPSRDAAVKALFEEAIR